MAPSRPCCAPVQSIAAVCHGCRTPSASCLLKGDGITSVPVGDFLLVPFRITHVATRFPLLALRRDRVVWCPACSASPQRGAAAAPLPAGAVAVQRSARRVLALRARTCAQGSVQVRSRAARRACCVHLRGASPRAAAAAPAPSASLCRLTCDAKQHNDEARWARALLAARIACVFQALRRPCPQACC